MVRESAILTLSPRLIALVAGFACQAVGHVTLAAPDGNTGERAEAQRYDEQIRPFLARHCFECHRGEKPKGDLRLDQLAPDFASEESRAPWREVRERVESGAMPPKPQLGTGDVPPIAGVSLGHHDLSHHVGWDKNAERAPAHQHRRRL